MSTTSLFFNSPFVASFGGKAMVAAFLLSAVVIGLVALNTLLVRALVDGQLVHAQLPAADAIDYYGQLLPGDRRSPAAGEPVVFGFRIQAFVTRAYVAGVEGAGGGSPRVAGIWTAAGEPARWPS
jgi:hypothetical protein